MDICILMHFMQIFMNSTKKLFEMEYFGMKRKLFHGNDLFHAKTEGFRKYLIS